MLNTNQIEFYARLQESRLKPEQISFQVEIMQSPDDVFWGNFEKVDFFFPSPSAIIKFLHDRYPYVLYYQIKCVPYPPACPQDYLFIDNPSYEYAKRNM